MEKQPLTLQQAQRLQDHFMYLVGEPLNTGSSDGFVVTCVAVVPFDEVYKYIFLLDYRQCDDPAAAIAFYQGMLFDVAVISRVVSDKVQILHKDLHVYLQERNIEMPDISNLPPDNVAAV
jgi:hypothetical protein